MKTGNKFVFTDANSRTNVTYYPFAPGPLVAGQKSGPELDYDGEEGRFTFRADEIMQEETCLGKLISVKIPQVEHLGLGPLTVALCLPPVAIGSDFMSQTFNTFAVKCHGQKEGYAPAPGCAMTYDLMEMQGTATCQFMPMAAAN